MHQVRVWARFAWVGKVPQVAAGGGRLGTHSQPSSVGAPEDASPRLSEPCLPPLLLRPPLQERPDGTHPRLQLAPLAVRPRPRPAGAIVPLVCSAPLLPLLLLLLCANSTAAVFMDSAELRTYLHAFSRPKHPQAAAAQLAAGGSRGALQVPRQLKAHHPETWRVSVWQVGAVLLLVRVLCLCWPGLAWHMRAGCHRCRCPRQRRL